MKFENFDVANIDSHILTFISKTIDSVKDIETFQRGTMLKAELQLKNMPIDTTIDNQLCYQYYQQSSQQFWVNKTKNN